jgi:hypothetical protein
MTSKELNRDVKKLFKKIYSIDSDSVIEHEKELKEEFTRLYYADTTLQSLSRENLLRMMRMNLRLRAVTLHYFGIGINERDLL